MNGPALGDVYLHASGPMRDIMRGQACGVICHIRVEILYF
ncbi:MAG: hypothetical protein ACJAXQ_000774 [Parvibaculaceae bacterium]|jgi:hypothetical protein